jgi:DNA-binding NtrC family response regulator
MTAIPHPTDAIMVGESRVIQIVRDQIAVLGATPLSILIQGETGSGKELVARALHDRSGRSGRFVPVDVCAISDSMFEDSLFGHVRGAFTGAIADRPGYLAEADHGTLFLDEIGDLHPHGQSKLLRALETHQFRPVGDRRDQRSDFRVVAATNQMIAQRISSGLFRADLAFRLRDAVIRVPPLRDRHQDIGLIAQHFVTLSLSSARGPDRLNAEAIRALEAYHWPGNVRELRQVIRRAVAFTQGSTIGLAQLERAWLAPDDVVGSPRVDTAFHDHADLVGRRLIDALERNDWDTVKAAKELGVTRKTVYARLARFGIAVPRRYRRRGSSPDTAQSEADVLHARAIHLESNASSSPTGKELMA